MYFAVCIDHRIAGLITGNQCSAGMRGAFKRYGFDEDSDSRLVLKQPVKLLTMCLCSLAAAGCAPNRNPVPVDSLLPLAALT